MRAVVVLALLVLAFPLLAAHLLGDAERREGVYAGFRDIPEHGHKVCIRTIQRRRRYRILRRFHA